MNEVTRHTVTTTHNEVDEPNCSEEFELVNIKLRKVFILAPPKGGGNRVERRK